MRAAPVVLMDAGLRITMPNTAPSAAPDDTPRMSGLASGLRTMRWKIWPGDAEREADEHAGERPGAGAACG